MRKGRFSHRSDELEETDVNLTPLIDVVFVVLIMFIIVAPLLELERVHLARGPSHENKEMTSASEMGSVHIHVRDDNSIRQKCFFWNVPRGEKRRGGGRF